MIRKLGIFLLFMVPILALAQSGRNGANSPFSRFGIGDLNEPGFMHLRQMGNITASFADAYHLNVVNPASYSFLSATSFEVGAESRISTYKDGTNQENTSSGRLSYMALGFPLKNSYNKVLENQKSPWNIGMAFYMLPVSTVAYDLSLTEDDPKLGNITRAFRGSGGIYKVGWGTGVKYNSLSAGVNLGVNFGKINNERNTTFNEDLGAFNNVYSNEYNVRGFDYNVGLLYQLVLNKNILEQLSEGKNIKAINFGMTAKGKTGFSGESEDFLRNQLTSPVFGTSTLMIDTLRQETRSLAGSTLPSDFSFGITYISGAKLALGFNYGITRWSEYNNLALSQSLTDTKRYSIGGYYRPNPTSITSFLSRVYYRFGLYYKEDPRSIESNTVDTYGVSLGLGLPFVFQRKVSHLSLGFDYGTRGTIDVLKENFFKVSLGFTFNDDEWFIKRKFN